MNIKEKMKEIEHHLDTAVTTTRYVDKLKEYLRQLLTHIKDQEETIKGYVLHLEQVCEDLYNLKAENKRLRELLEGYRSHTSSIITCLKVYKPITSEIDRAYFERTINHLEILFPKVKDALSRDSE